MQVIQGLRGGTIKTWTEGVPVEEAALQQLHNVAGLPFVRGVAVMPDVHFGLGATVGSVIATKGAVIPAAVGVDIGCGMSAVRTSLTAEHLPDSLVKVRTAIERAVPKGFESSQSANHSKGSWNMTPDSVATVWRTQFADRWESILAKNPRVDGKTGEQLGTMGGGNHFIELCLDEENRVWLMLHSGSRGTGNRIGQYFINQAKELMATNRADFFLPDKDLAYLAEGTPLFEDYVEAMTFAQEYAMANRQLMVQRTLGALRAELPVFTTDKTAINCHHNFTLLEHHAGENVWLTRKGAVSARKDQLGIIPGSMGAKSFIVRGKGNPDSYCSCSHGAGRTMSRTRAKAEFTVEDHAKATEGVECRKDAGVLDETPGAYKSIDAVMAAQTDLVEVVHTLKQVVCVKG